MNVQQLIDELMLVKDKTQTVLILSEFGRGCWSESDDVSVSERDPDEGSGVVIYGDESRNDGGE